MPPGISLILHISAERIGIFSFLTQNRGRVLSKKVGIIFLLTAGN